MSPASKPANRELIPPLAVGITARIVVSLMLLALAAYLLTVGGAWIVVAAGAGIFGILIGLAAVVRQAGCEVNLIWNRLLRKGPIDCFLFARIDRWERDRREAALVASVDCAIGREGRRCNRR